MKIEEFIKNLNTDGWNDRDRILVIREVVDENGEAIEGKMISNNFPPAQMIGTFEICKARAVKEAVESSMGG